MEQTPTKGKENKTGFWKSLANKFDKFLKEKAEAKSSCCGPQTKGQDKNKTSCCG